MKHNNLAEKDMKHMNQPHEDVNHFKKGLIRRFGLHKTSSKTTCPRLKSFGTFVRQKDINSV